MILFRLLFALILCLLMSHTVTAQDPAENSSKPKPQAGEQTLDFSGVIVPITKLKILPEFKMSLKGRPVPKLGESLRFGTGFCLDHACRFIVTNYHVARVASPRKIKGQRVIQRYLDTGPEDRDATISFDRDHDVVPYAAKHDLALFELRQPIPKHQGLKYSLDDLVLGQEVSLCGYTLNLNPFRHLVCVPARFKGPTTSGLLAFGYESSDHARGGMSGGIVVDRKTQRIVGVLSEANDTMALAVPVQNLLDFVSKVEPFVAVKTFPAFKNANPMSVDLYPEFEPPPDFNSKFEPTHSGVLQRRPAEPDDVVMLREKAQRLADSMRNFIALYSYSLGSGDKEPEAHEEYEVRVVDGEQRFRTYPDGKKDLKEVEFPRLNGWALGANEWTELPKMVGTEYKLKIQRANDSEIDGKKIKVFQYYAALEDKVCGFRPIEDYIFFIIDKSVDTSCYGEAWMDSDGNIIRISSNLDLSEKLKEYRGWLGHRTVVTYGLIKIGDEPSRPAPLTVFVEGHNNKKSYWCRGTFTNYRLFASRSRLLAATQNVDEQGKPEN